MGGQIYECFLLLQNKKRCFYQRSVSFPFLLVNSLIYIKITFKNEQKVFQKENYVDDCCVGGLLFLENMGAHIRGH